ncbi:MAG TPA: nucleoside recognition domain-containing protein [Tepidisphaeraceae bacterium]|jgi:spore maturation protein A|nr:nucleoside recognition domain-containing protein [Tepidisphaeraceae bacterium]
MLNYIWAGLIICSLVFAMTGDINDLRHDTYRNDQSLPITLKYRAPYDPAAKEIPVDVVIAPDVYTNFYGVSARPALSYSGTLIQGGKSPQLRFAADVPLPEPLSTIREAAQSDSSEIGQLQGVVHNLSTNPSVTLDPVRFYKLGKITKAAISMAGKAVNLAIGLIGGLALWLGVLRIAEKSGLIDAFVRLVRPVLHPLFPEIPKDHPALGMIALNLSAGMLGLGNAATPMGLKAMEELQKLNPTSDTATNPMVMLLALNTTCVQLIPSATLVAIIGLQAGEVWLPTVLSTAGAMVVAIIATKLLGRLHRYRSTDPNRQPAI